MNKTALAILVSIILTIIIVSTVNVGISLFLERPEYNDYCPILERGEWDNETACMEAGGIWNPSHTEELESGMTRIYENNCDLNKDLCREEYNKALEKYNQIRFYILAAIGFILLLIGLFHKELLIEITGLSTGGILVFEGIVFNLQNKLIVFITLIAMLAIFGILAYRVVKKVN